MAVSLWRRTLVVVPLCVAVGCKTGGGAIAAPKDEAYHAHVITAEAIERSGATDAWEVLKRLSTTARATESYDGQPERLHPRRGHGSLYLRDDPMVYINGVPLCDIRALRQIGAVGHRQYRGDGLDRSDGVLRHELQCRRDPDTQQEPIG